MKFFPFFPLSLVVLYAVGLAMLSPFPQAQAQQKATPLFSQPASTPQLVIQSGHTAYVGNLTVAPRGDFYATGDKNGIVKLWARPGHDLQWATASGGEGISSLQFSPDGSKLLALSAVGLWLWEVKSGNQLWHSSEEGMAMRFSPDSNSIVSIRFDGTSERFDTAGHVLSQKKRTSSLGSSVSIWAISPDSRLLASDELVRETWDIGVVSDASSLETRQRLSISTVHF